MCYNLVWTEKGVDSETGALGIRFHSQSVYFGKESLRFGKLRVDF